MLNYMGRDGFVWFQGVVEDRNDPLKLGRCRIRCLGLHTNNKANIQTEDLPWAYPAQPITSAAMNGVGQTPLGPVEGTWVLGFFRDGANCQDPVYFATIGGIPQEKSKSHLGFNDPNGKYPKEEYIGEADTNRLARGVTQGTVVESKSNTLDKNNPIANSSGTWSEPTVPYAAAYPFNHVRESESGHVQEFDDTHGAERIHTYHKSGSFEEYHPNGTKVTKVTKDNYEIVAGDNFVHIAGKVNVVVDGSATLLVKGNADIQVDGNATEVIGGNSKQTVHGNATIECKDSIKVSAKNNTTITTGGSMTITSGGPMRLRGSTIDLN